MIDHFCAEVHSKYIRGQIKQEIRELNANQLVEVPGAAAGVKPTRARQRRLAVMLASITRIVRQAI